MRSQRGSGALWATAFYAGLRRGEIRALRSSDLDLEAKRLRVERAWDDKEGVIAGKMFAARRSVPVFAPLARDLAAHKVRTGRRGEDLLFGITAEQPFDPSTVRRHARAAWKRAGVEPIGLHEARHTAASFIIAAGFNLKELSKTSSRLAKSTEAMTRCAAARRSRRAAT